MEWLLHRIEEAVVGKDPSFRLARKQKVREELGIGSSTGPGEGGNVVVLVDLPGQAELYLNHPSLKQVVNAICELGLTPCLLELYDCTYLYQVEDFVSVCMMTLTSMLNLDMPHLSLLSKIDVTLAPFSSWRVAAPLTACSTTTSRCPLSSGCLLTWGSARQLGFCTRSLK